MIQVLDLHYAYGTHTVLKGVSFTIEQPGLTALLGCNGAGKTTLFRCLLGLMPEYTGRILLNEKELKSYAPRELAAEIAYIPQSHYPTFNYSVLDMVLMGTTQQLGAFSSPGAEQRKTALQALERLGIGFLAERGFLRLSGGEQQLVLIARAIAQKARILLMDEPCASLDFGNQHRVMDIARRLGKEGYTVIMSTHSPQQVLTYADRVIALSEGTLMKDGAPAQAMDDELMQCLYRMPVRFFDTELGRVVMADPARK